MIQEETILVLAKTYPNCSKKKGCTSCIAGINELGEWRRIYPFTFDFFYKTDGFKKWDLVRMELKEREDEKDRRSESFDLVSEETVEVVGTVDNPFKRLRYLEEHCYTTLCELQNASKEIPISEMKTLAIIKPQIIEFKEKTRNQLHDNGDRLVYEKMEIQNLWDYMTPRQRVLASKGFMKSLTDFNWIGYKFHCGHPECRGHEIQSTDWETIELHRKMVEKFGPEEGFEKTRYKFFDWMLTRELYFCMGTVWRFKTWLIISVQYPPKRVAETLDSFFEMDLSKSIA